MEVGNRRFERILEPVSGKAVPVRKGEILRVSQLVGSQCVDFNAFNLHDYKEHLAVGSSRRGGFRLREGGVLLTNPPRYRPMFALLHIPDSSSTDTLAARCDSILFERKLGFAFHTNCQDTLSEAIREYDLTPDDVHDSFNLFMNTSWDASGSWWIDWNTSKQGDHIDLLACMDTLSVPVVCGSGDVERTSNFFLKPVHIEVFQATEETLDIVSRIEREYSARTRKSVDDFGVKQIRTQRELYPNPDYEQDYPGFPLEKMKLKISLDRAAFADLEGIADKGFATDIPDAVRRLFMSWILKNLIPRRGEQINTQPSPESPSSKDR
jgi:uncharacterized protein YcgI (DUF1989 family)